MKITIEKLKSGFIITDENNEQYAVWYLEQMVAKIRELFGIEKKQLKKKELVQEHANKNLPEHQISETPPIITASELKPVESIDINEPIEPTQLQKRKGLAQAKDAHGLLIPKFEYDESQKKEIEGYTNLSVVEMPDGRAVVMYKGTHYYTTKEKILTIPFPTPFGYFKGKGVCSVAVTCLRAYRNYLANPAPQQSAYVSKSTQDRIKEASERKPVPLLMTAEDVLELEMQREVERRKGDARPPKLDMKEKKDMTIKMGVQ